MANSRPFLGETTDREEAFSGIEAFELRVVQDRFGYYSSDERLRESRFTKANIPRHLSCRNPRCQQGGLDLQQIVLFWGAGEHTLFCSGHEGTPKGRRKGNPCDNSFQISLSIENDRTKFE